MTLVIWT
jgi:hypothetical protein